MSSLSKEEFCHGPEDEPEADGEDYEPLDLVEIHESDLGPGVSAED